MRGIQKTVAAIAAAVRARGATAAHLAAPLGRSGYPNRGSAPVKGPESRRGPHRVTPLQQYLDQRGIPAARVEAKLRERLLGRAPSRQQLLRWRLGRVEPQRTDMVRILWAVREASLDGSVRMDELFDLDPRNEGNWCD
jgi:hypothetical protein